jgi:hypothetical protein
MNPGMRNLKRINICGALNKPSLQGKWYIVSILKISPF